VPATHEPCASNQPVRTSAVRSTGRFASFVVRAVFRLASRLVSMKYAGVGELAT
jgi:hypothetical protein